MNCKDSVMPTLISPWTLLQGLQVDGHLTQEKRAILLYKEHCCAPQKAPNGDGPQSIIDSIARHMHCPG